MSVLRSTPRPADVEAVRRLLDSTGFFSAEEVAIGVELIEESLARGEAAGYRYRFADDVDEEGADLLLGYCCYGAIPLTRESWDLYWIAVAPEAQGRGVGRRLLSAAETDIRSSGGRLVFVDTSGRPQYQPTRSFYAARGYDVVARLTDFYAPGDDKVVYRRKLP